VAALVQRVVSYFELVAEERRVTLHAVVSDADGAVATLWADESLVTRALGNLVSNALRYAPLGTEVTVTARAVAHGGCEIEVLNRGARIAAEHLDRIFERFYRVDSARDASSGSGLGLAIVRSIVSLHGGRVTVASDDATTAFTLHFPALGSS
jgi:two-component system heavy metal sensor histidine kinase CusS